jgi:hypothetical protein
VAGLFQLVRDSLRHVGLVVLGEHGIGLEHAIGVERAFGNDALPFAEQIRQNALISHRQRCVSIGHFKLHLKLLAAHQRSLAHQTAETETLAGLDVLFGDHSGRREEHDGVAQRIEHERSRDREHRERSPDQRQSPLLARH